MLKHKPKKRYGIMGMGGYIGLSDNLNRAKAMATIRGEHTVYYCFNGCYVAASRNTDSWKWETYNV